MSFLFETLAPLILIAALGAGLARVRFLGPDFIKDLNRLAFWVALPALLFVSASHAGQPGSQTWKLLGILLGATLLISFVAWGLSFPLGMPANTRGTLIQSAFRGNLAYIGIPVLAYSVGEDEMAFATAVVVMIVLMSFYNILAVIVLHKGSLRGSDGRRMLGSIFTNPLLLAGVLGLLFAWMGICIPLFLDRALSSLGTAAVPIALLCIGGSLATTTLRGRWSWIVVAALLKIAILPVVVFCLARVLGLGMTDQRIALVLSSCPTAAAAYVMVKQMGGDEALASGSIVLSTLFSVLTLAVALWVTA